MAELAVLIDFIEDNPPESRFWNSSEWETNLTKSIPEWRDIIAEAYKDPREWEQIENSRPKIGYKFLCQILVSSVGLELAKGWFYSDVDDQKWAVTWWLNNNTHLWSKFDSNMKDEVLTRTFDRYPGEPYKSLEALTKFKDRRGEPSESLKALRRSLEIILRAAGYVPSPQIKQLRDIVEEAGDEEYLAKIDEMISQREKACELREQRVPCNPNRNERELIARLMEITGKSGYSPAALPPILLSSETPPIFVKYPELEEDEDNERDEQDQDQIPRNRERRRPETISIEELLGVYQPRQEQIIIYERGIRWRRHRLNEEWLFAVVLIHEIAHWITHKLPKPKIPAWNTDLYIQGHTNVHEGWAQLMTWWIADQVGGKFKRTFEKLNRNQPAPYRVFKQFKDEPIDKVMASLEKLRLLSQPAQLRDWKEAIPKPISKK